MKYIQILLAILIITASTACFALDLKSAKNQGLVGETQSGYLASPKAKSSADVKELISDINAKRQQHYAKIAAKVGKSLAVVEKLAGKKAIEKTSKGRFVQSPNGSWLKK